MKRSRSVELVLMGTVPFLLTACDRPEITQPAPLAYQSVQQCLNDGKVSADVCQSEYDRALAQHQQMTPRFTNIYDCAAQYGYEQCHPIVTSSGSSFFGPALAGYLIGSAIQRHRDDRQYYSGGYSGSTWSTQPIYRERGDRSAWRTGQGETIGYGQGARGPAAATTAETLSRGGFGSSSAARGSWGG